MAEVKSERELSLIQKLSKIRSIADVVKKSKKGYNYSYSDITEILAKITAGMNKYGVSLIPSILSGSASVTQHTATNTKFDKTGKPYDNTTTEMLVTAEMVFSWIDDDNPEDRIDVPWFIVGSQSDPSQAFGSGLTYCTRYFLCNYFQIAQTDSDVDAYRSKQKEAEKSEETAIAVEIVGQIDTMIKECLTANPDKSDEIKKFVSKYVKGANYLAIKDPAIAAKLLNDFKEKYFKEA